MSNTQLTVMARNMARIEDGVVGLRTVGGRVELLQRRSTDADGLIWLDNEIALGQVLACQRYQANVSYISCQLLVRKWGEL